MPDAQLNTTFDLDAAVASWRLRLSQAESMSRDAIDELEDHLRRELRTLRVAGLEDREAWTVARSRLGEPGLLDEQYGQAHAGRVWRRRVFWMIGGYLLIHTWAHVTGSVVMPLMFNQVALFGLPPVLGYTLLFTLLGLTAGLLIALMHWLGTRRRVGLSPAWSAAGGVAVVVGAAGGYLLIALLETLIYAEFMASWAAGVFWRYSFNEPDSFWNWEYLLYVLAGNLQGVFVIGLLALAAVLAWRGMAVRRVAA
ncbi:MAG: hypothetical protein AAF823_15200 [Planctomycetota bacterium]